MRKEILFVALLLMLQHNSFSQKIKPKFASINLVGVALGGSDQDLQLQTINGVSYKTYTVGLGAALDQYFHRTIPLFLDLRKDVFSKTQTPFAYAELGLNMPWIKRGDQTWYKSDYDPGTYFDVGVGYKIKVHKKFSANLSFGYSEKRVKEKRERVAPFDFLPNNEGYESLNYALRRFSVKAGLSF